MKERFKHKDIAPVESATIADENTFAVASACGMRLLARLKPLRGYAIKVLVLCAAFALYSAFAPTMPPVLIAVFWAAAALVSFAAVAYRAVIHKLTKRVIYQDGGRLAQFNEGRVVRLVITFVFAAACSASLLVDVPSWKPQDWVMLIAAALLAPAVFVLVERFNSREYNELFRMAKSAVATGILLCALLCVLGATCALLIPGEQYASAFEAFQSVPKPFENSPSSLIAQVGLFASFGEGLTALFMSRAADASALGYAVLWVAMHAAGFAALAGMLASCLLPLSELRRIVSPLEAGEGKGAADFGDTGSEGNAAGELAFAARVEMQGTAGKKQRSFAATTGIVGRYAATCVLLPVILVAGFVAADALVASNAASQERNWAQEFVHEQIGLSVYVLDGKYYDQQAVDETLSQISGESEQLVADAQQNLVPLINDSFDKRIANVDSYLDWYYSLSADYDRLVKVFTGTIEEGLQQQLEEKLSEGVDDTQLNEQYSEYVAKAAALQEELQEKLSQSEIDGDVPTWLLNISTLDQGTLDGATEPSQKFMEDWERLGTSAVAGVIAGKVIKKAATKVIEKLAKRVATSLAERGIMTTGGAIVGSAAGPVGTGIGFVAGAAVSVATDYLFLKADEIQNREMYKQELIDSLNEQRDKMIAAIG